MTELPITQNTGDLLFYQTEDGLTRVEVRLQDDTLWLNQAQMMELFQTTKQNISLHIKNIFTENELIQKIYLFFKG